jgi:hypothetical protein
MNQDGFLHDRVHVSRTVSGCSSQQNPLLDRQWNIPGRLQNVIRMHHGGILERKPSLTALRAATPSSGHISVDSPGDCSNCSVS